MRFIRMVPKLPLDITVPQYALRRRGAICVSAIVRDLYEVRISYNYGWNMYRLVLCICIICFINLY